MQIPIKTFSFQFLDRELGFPQRFFFPLSSQDPINIMCLCFFCSLNIKVKWKRDLANVLRTKQTIKKKKKKEDPNLVICYHDLDFVRSIFIWLSNSITFCQAHFYVQVYITRTDNLFLATYKLTGIQFILSKVIY